METLILSNLVQKDPSIHLMVEENKQLLANKDIKFKVYKDGGSYFGTHATKLKGTMQKNGYVYMKAYKTMSPLMPFAHSMHPIEFEGEINWEGRIDLKVSKKRFRLFGSRVPEEFIGNIDEKGKVEMSVVKSYFEWAGTYYIHKLLFDPFKGNKEKRSRFIDNAVAIKRKVQDYMEENLNSNNMH